MLIPLSIINHFKPTRILPGEKQLHELYPLGTEQADTKRLQKFQGVVKAEEEIAPGPEFFAARQAQISLLSAEGI